jgi:eukaryotic-like serine/threonine-protein kinase
MAEERVMAGRYRLGRSLGRGGFSEVRSAEDGVLGREVAVKLLAGAADQPDLVRRLDREARALARLSHPNVVAVYDAGLDGPDAYVVMELLAGPSLAELLADRGPLPVPVAVRYAMQAADALAAAHAIGIVHRDIKPGNLVLAADGTVKVVDFGIAALSFGTATFTATATSLGTPAYLSPEQAAGQAAGPGSDLYSLGCVLFALLTGEPPFAGEHPVAFAHQHLTAVPPSARARRPEVPPQLDALLAALLAKDPADRPADAATVRDWLAAAEAALSPGRTTPAFATVPLAPPPYRLPRRGGRRWWALPALAAGGLALTVLAVMAASAGSQPAAAQPPAASTRPQPAAARSHTARPSPARTRTATAPPVTPAREISAARLALVLAENAGTIQPSDATDLQNQLNDISMSINQGNLQDAGQKTADLLHHLADLNQGGQITPAGLAAIQPPLLRLATLLPAQHAGD